MHNKRSTRDCKNSRVPSDEPESMATSCTARGHVWVRMAATTLGKKVIPLWVGRMTEIVGVMGVLVQNDGCSNPRCHVGHRQYHASDSGERDAMRVRN